MKEMEPVNELRGKEKLQRALKLLEESKAAQQSVACGTIAFNGGLVATVVIIAGLKFGLAGALIAFAVSVALVGRYVQWSGMRTFKRIAKEVEAFKA